MSFVVAKVVRSGVVFVVEMWLWLALWRRWLWLAWWRRWLFQNNDGKRITADSKITAWLHE